MSLLHPPTTHYTNTKAFEVGIKAHKDIYDFYTEGREDIGELAKAGIEWLESNGFIFIVGEQLRVNLEHKYGGRIDGIFKGKDDKYYLVDYKFLNSNNLSTSYFLQMEAYCHFSHYVENNNIFLPLLEPTLPSPLLLVINKKDYRVTPHYVKLNPKLLRVFLGACSVWHYKFALLK